jgi:alkaline phosphatase
MPARRALRIVSTLAAIVLFGWFGIGALLHRYNLSLVFYDPGWIFTVPAQSTRAEPYPLMPDRDIKRVVLFIGDGMGLSHLTAARIHWLGPDGRLHMERMPVTGLLAVHAATDLITDSAASATALATGIKTTNSSIGVDPDGNERLTILEAARDAGMSTGLVTTTDLTDATPAAFATHVPDRGMKAEIAAQLLAARLNVLLGEGEQFYPRSDRRSAREDDADPLPLAKDLGYEVVLTREQLLATRSNLLLGIFEDLTTDRLRPGLTPSNEPPSLAQMTAKALELLSRNPAGFFLLVEEEGTDPGSHVNRPDYFLHHVKSLDAAVEVAIDFARRDGQTLVIVTADHETGGMNILGGSSAEQALELVWDTDRHTGQPVPLFAFGPHALRFTGLKDNTEIPGIFADLLRLETWQRR